MVNTNELLDSHEAYLRLLLATLDEDDEEAHKIIDGADLVELTHLLAGKLVYSLTGDQDLFDAGADEDHPSLDAQALREELRRDLQAILQELEADA